MRSLLALLLLAGCTAPSDGEDPKDTGEADADTDADTDTDTDTDTQADQDRDEDSYPAGIDCDDTRADVNPGVALDVCNGRDDDCDTTVDEDPDLNWYADADADGFGAGASQIVACDPGAAGYAPNAADCDDGEARAFPGADDVCDGIDNDCNGGADDNPGTWSAWYPDADRDGYGAAGSTPLVTCDPGSAAYTTNDLDCDDARALVSPEGDEVCDGRDNDCNGGIDDDESDWSAFYEDADGDGAGVDALVYGCDAVSAGGAENAWDCDDSDPDEPVFVDTAGSSRGTGALSDPLATIQDAIYLANTCVAVGPGTYYEDLNFYGRNITVEGVDGAASTTLQGTGGASVVTFEYGESSDAVLRGFTITGGSGRLSSSSYYSGSTYYYYYYGYGGGLYLSTSSPTLEDLVVTGNGVYEYYSYCPSSSTCYYYEGFGGGMYVYEGSPTLTDVAFLGNSAGQGSAVYQNYGSLTGTRIRSEENYSSWYSWYLYDATVDLENVLMNSDYSNYGQSGIWSDSADLTITNATLVSLDYGLYAYASTVDLHNSVLYANTYGLYEGSRGGSTWYLGYNNAYGNGYDYYNVSDPTGTNGNIQVEPGFVSFSDDYDASSDDLSLLSRSSMVDAGDPDAAYKDTDGTTNDIGAYGGPNAFP